MDGFSFETPGPEWSFDADVRVATLATDLANRLIEAGRSKRKLAQALISEEARAFDLRDVLASLWHFDLQRRMLERRGLYFPCLDMPDSDVPLPIALSLVDPHAPMGTNLFAEELALSSLPASHVNLYDHDRAREFVRGRLMPFLATKISTAKSSSGGPPGSGFPFRVETPGRSGLRVHYSPAYFLGTGGVFGNVLSTPVDGHLPPGRYIFGTMAPAGALKWDRSGVYRIPGPFNIAQVF